MEQTQAQTTKQTYKEQKPQKKTIPTGPQREILMAQYRLSRDPKNKQTLCRFFLRGNCMFSTEECHYAHGIQDLVYVKAPHNPRYATEYSFSNPAFSEQSLFRGELNYHVLHRMQDQQNLKYTLDQINSDRHIREELRRKLLDQQFSLFIHLLQDVNGGQTIFTQDYVAEEYYRLGFNKLMTRVKYDFLVESLCERPDSQWMVVQDKRKAWFIKKESEETILKTYVEFLKTYCNQNEEQESLTQRTIRAILYKYNKNQRIPMPHYMMQFYGISFEEFMSKVINLDEQLKARFPTFSLIDDSEQLLKAAVGLLENQSFYNLKQLFEQALVKSASKVAMKYSLFKTSLQVKGFKIYQIATHTFIYNPKGPLNLAKHECPCTNKSLPESVSEIECRPLSEQLASQAVIIVDSKQILQQVPHLFEGCTQVAVDIEGRLRKGGCIEIIQIATPKHVILFDFDGTKQKKQCHLLKAMQNFVKKIMLDPKIVKVLHDCRHDSLALHHIFQTCVLNVRDTSGLHVIRTQEQSKQNTTLNMPGLNELLSTYNASHGINPHKDKFHRMMAEGNKQLFKQRPINPEYLEYCVKDVLDLCEVAQKIGAAIPEQLQKYVGMCYVKDGYQAGL